MPQFVGSLRLPRCPRAIWVGVGLLVAAISLGCQSSGGSGLPPDPSMPWVPIGGGQGQTEASTLAASVNTSAGSASLEPAGQAAMLERTSRRSNFFTAQTMEYAGARESYVVPAVPAAASPFPAPIDVPQHALTLPELIDIAQRTSPLTRIAWEEARQAAIAVGMAESLYLPLITAAAVGGWQRTRSPLPIAIGELDSIHTTASGVIPALTLQWLLFDFGERAAGVDAARHLSFAANVQFQGAHQRLIQAVALAYYNYDTARIRTRVAAQALANAETVLEAVSARHAQGLATVVELAQARRQVAQARMLQVQAQGLERDGYQALIAAIGLPADTRLNIRTLQERALPASLHEYTEEQLRAALARRPDVLSAYAAAQAAEEGVKAAEATFAPKVFLSGVAAVTHHRLNVNGLSLLGQPVSSAGILLGVTLPLYDGGLRRQHLHAARSRADQAKAVWQQTQENAVVELVSASSTLKTALQAHEAAQEWARASATTYDAALEAYRYGVGTLTVASEAMLDLLAAQMAEVDAYAGALSAAVNMAHAIGQLTSADDVAYLHSSLDNPMQ